MNLVGLVVPGQHMHDQIDPKAIRDLALTFAGIAATDGIKRIAACIHCPGRCPIVAADDHRGDVVVEIAKRHAFDQFRIRRRGFDPDITAVVTTGEILKQVEGARQNVVFGKRFKRRNVQRCCELLQLATIRASGAETGDVSVAGVEHRSARQSCG